MSPLRSSRRTRSGHAGERRQLCHLGLQEDHLSLGTPAALKALKLAKNVQKILAVSILPRRRPTNSWRDDAGGRHDAGLAHIRRMIPPTEADRFMSPDLAAADALLAEAARSGYEASGVDPFGQAIGRLMATNQQ